MDALTLEGVTRTFRTRQGAVHAVRDLNLSVGEGELVVLVGPSGCGKTTTLRLIAGLAPACAGAIRIGGKVVNDMPPRERDVAMVFQDHALYPNMNVYDNLAFSLKMRGARRAEIEESVMRAARKLGIEPLLGRKPRQLSGGEGQRVALGRAMVRRPRVFLLDEPLSQLDPALRLSARTQIKGLQRELGTGALYVTHDQEEAMTLADRLAVLREGRLQQAGAPLEVYHRPANRFVAGFLGSPPMNFFSGVVQRIKGEIFFLTQGLRIPLPAGCVVEPGPGDGRVVLGVRPHDVRLAPMDKEGRAEGTWGNRACVDLVEPLGDTTNVHARLSEGCRLMVRGTALENVQVGQWMRVDFDADRLHFFSDDQAGGRLKGGRQGG